ncbi:T-lymphocyte surface antigen Ly-9 [Anoplopoma fimbria]|uniref:T-lymphocyte surface antigen Ly-9 n=1 Tax=Anoplopoma fimbria TaxID=229290 RepID=UPI0023EB22D1|nr:T-lymphocyte surface antigen Ly-9 [Anoplopoma fimbria]
MLLLLSCWMIAGVTAKDQPSLHYRVKNSSICIQVEKSLRQNTWLLNKKAIVLDKIITPRYKDKVDYDPINHTLCINKLTETDSGNYTFQFINSEDEQSEEIHRLIVQESVPRPVIRMSGLHSNLSAGQCNITVKCSIRDEWVWSVCDEVSCITSEESLREVNITIFTGNRSIVCSGNNHVSTSNVSESTEAMCKYYVRIY